MKRTWSETFKSLRQKNMLIALLMGFSSGVPLLLTGKTLQAWLVDSGVDIKTIGLYALVGLPYSLKFIWSPLMDRYTISKFGRRRGWLLLTQGLLLLSLAWMSTLNPRENLWLVSLVCLFTTFFSASQDIVVDAFRRESLKDDELGMGSALYVYGYRIALWITGALALILADHLPWSLVYLIMAAMLSVGIVATLWAKEPTVSVQPRTLRDSVVLPLKDFFSREQAWIILLFILLYKVGDTMAGQMTQVFYLKVGFTKTEIGAIAKTIGLFSNLAGTAIGGLAIMRMGLFKSLWIFGIFQALSTLSFMALTIFGHDPLALSGVIAFEDITGGMGTAAFVAFIGSLTNKSFTATQYALMTSLMGIPRTILSSPTGYIVDYLGWNGFFVFCTLAAVPGLFILTKIQKNITA